MSPLYCEQEISLITRIMCWLTVRYSSHTIVYIINYYIDLVIHASIAVVRRSRGRGDVGHQGVEGHRPSRIRNYREDIKMNNSFLTQRQIHYYVEHTES